METIIGLFKTECIRTMIFHKGLSRPSPTWNMPPPAGYNHRRLHGSLGMVPPAEFEHAHYAALTPQEQPV
jgi:transposase InsO family protein